VSRTSPPLASAETRAARFDARAEVVAVSLDGGAVVEADADGRSSVLRHEVVSDSQPEQHRVVGSRDSQHQGIPHRLDVLASNGR
jgi:hypothetical protein